MNLGKLLFIFFVILVSIFVVLVTYRRTYSDIKFDEEEPHFIQPTFKNHLFDLSKFNFNGKCGEIFKYKKNNERDLLFYSVCFQDKNKWLQQKETSMMAATINRHTIPNAKFVLYLHGEEPEEGFIENFRQLGFDVIRSNIVISQTQTFNAAVQRFLDFEEYLEKHENEFDRVVISDFRDIIWFADGFQTMSPDELFMSSECWGSPVICKKISKGSSKNKLWFEHCYGKKLAKEFGERNVILLNTGFFASGMKLMRDFIKIYNNEIRSKPEHANYWGFDQAIINYIYHSGKLKHLNVTLNTMTQKFGFGMYDKCHTYDSERKVVYEFNGKCSPVIRHKLKGLFG